LLDEIASTVETDRNLGLRRSEFELRLRISGNARSQEHGHGGSNSTRKCEKEMQIQRQTEKIGECGVKGQGPGVIDGSYLIRTTTLGECSICVEEFEGGLELTEIPYF